MEKARAQVASIIGADEKEIIFTSGATESNNLAIKGVAHFYKGKKNHIITVVTEHKCVLDSCRHLELEGFEVTYLPVQQNGLIDLEQLKAAIRPDTVHRLGDGGEQRDRRDPAAGGDRQDLPRSQGRISTPTRRRRSARSRSMSMR